MSDKPSTDPPVLRLRSPFNGEPWCVPPEVTPAMLEALLQAGFTRMPGRPPKDPRVA